MGQTMMVGELSIEVTRKDVKRVHLSVHPPLGRVTLVAPSKTRLEVIRAYVVSKLPWIRSQQQRFRDQARESPREFVERESHDLWGRRHLLSVVERDARPRVAHDHRRITLYVRPGSDLAKRRAVMDDWHRSLLHEVVPGLIAKWQPKLNVVVRRYFLQRMKTKWGSCNSSAGHIRLNAELVKKPKDLLEYVVVHEMVHLIVPTHSKRFTEILRWYYPSWQVARSELNDLPVAAEDWDL